MINDFNVKRYNNDCPNFSFMGNSRKVKDALGELKYRNNSAFFRPDLRCNRLADKLIEKYHDVDKVQIYNYACSEGAEPYSLAMILIKKLGKEKSKKFFPIIASDIDEEILENPKQGIVKVSPFEFLMSRLSVGKKFKEFVIPISNFKYDPKFRNVLKTANVSSELKDSVIFKQADILKDIDNIEEENSVVLCRNFFPYLSDENKNILAQKLSEKLGKNSMCVIGTYDTFCLNMHKLFINQGLTEVDKNSLWYASK